jgi:hypothetical protein
MKQNGKRFALILAMIIAICVAIFVPGAAPVFLIALCFAMFIRKMNKTKK